MTEAAGANWCTRFPGSVAIDDLVEPFKTGVNAFIAALRGAGASVDISATYRPPERAFLMHWACLIAGYRDADKIFHQIAAGDVPANPAVKIDWTCGGDPGAARSAAVAMVREFGIVYPAALASRHTERRAIDMTIRFPGSIMVATRSGRLLPAASLNDLVPIGATYGVMKLKSDAPHWSEDGH